MVDTDEDKSLMVAARDTALLPLRVASSKPAQRAYIRTALLISTSIILACIAATAYVLFYYAYIPTRGFSRPVHLQFDPESHPYGSVSLLSNIVSGQPYDVRVLLHLPRTPINKDAGNFMIDLAFTSPASSGDTQAVVVARERRPAILTYYSPHVELIHKARDLPWYMLGWQHEAETLDIPMMEGVEFAKGRRNLPANLELRLLSESKLQIYTARVVFTARLHGLRYLMYNYRTLSFFVFTAAFWGVEMLFASLVWAFFSFTLFSSQPPSAQTAPKQEPASEESPFVKTEEHSGAVSAEDFSDTSRTYPTFSRQPPLRYSSQRVKKEETDESGPAMETIPPAMEADDEDEYADFVMESTARLGGRSDSGLGTSLESGTDPQSARRRGPRLFPGGGRSRSSM